MSRYLVTGGCGFIGVHLVKKLLHDNHQVIVIDNLSTGKQENLPSEAQLVIGDIRDQALLSETMRGVDGCFHLAALVGITLCKEQWLETHEVNLTGAISVFNVASQLKLKFGQITPIVYASSCAVYGDSTELPYSETTLPKPISAYGADKFGCELHARVASLVHEIPTIGIRIFNVYGPGQRKNSPYSGVLTLFLENMFHDKPIEIFGDGNQTRDFIFVEDIVRFLTYFMDNMGWSPNVFNACTGTMNTINELIYLLEKHSHKIVEKIYLPPREGDTLFSVGNPMKAREAGISAIIDLDKGLQKLIANF